MTALLDDLDTHVEREDLGIFPVSVVTLGATGWATVDDARRDSPSFLLDVLPQGTRPTHPDLKTSTAPDTRRSTCRRSH